MWLNPPISYLVRLNNECTHTHSIHNYPERHLSKEHKLKCKLVQLHIRSRTQYMELQIIYTYSKWLIHATYVVLTVHCMHNVYIVLTDIYICLVIFAFCHRPCGLKHNVSFSVALVLCTHCRKEDYRKPSVSQETWPWREGLAPNIVIICVCFYVSRCRVHRWAVRKLLSRGPKLPGLRVWTPSTAWPTEYKANAAGFILLGAYKHSLTPSTNSNLYTHRHMSNINLYTSLIHKNLQSVR